MPLAGAGKAPRNVLHGGSRTSVGTTAGLRPGPFRDASRSALERAAGIEAHRGDAALAAGPPSELAGVTLDDRGETVTGANPGAP